MPHARPRPLTRAALAVAAALAVLVPAACAPAPVEGPVAAEATARPAELDELERTAWQAWHFMELGRLGEGTYTTNALIDLELPQGVRWDLVDFSDDGYRLRVMRVEEDGTERDAWIVEPAGVRPAG